MLRWPRPHGDPTFTTPELLVSHFYFIPNIRDIQCFSVSYWGGGASNQNREITPHKHIYTKPNQILMELRAANQKKKKNSSQIWNQPGRFASGGWKISLMLVNTSKTWSGGRTSVFRVKRNRETLRTRKQSQCWFWQNPPTRQQDPPEPRENPPGVRSKVTSVSPFPVLSTKPINRDEVTQVTSRGTGSTLARASGSPERS